MDYVIITPAKNEEKYIRYTLDSVVNQTLKPVEWIIVNDGSTDRTAEIVEEYVKKHVWIKLITIRKNEKRAPGSKVVRAFYSGYTKIKKDYDVISKLDADLTLPINYFRKVIDSFQDEKKVGLCGGYCKINKKGKWIKEKTASYHVRGAFKAYRREAFEDIGGFDEVLGWDGLDQMKLLHKGWNIKVLDLSVKHHRVTGEESDISDLNFELGVACYKKGYSWFITLIHAIVSLIRKKKVKPFIMMLKGYYHATIIKEKKNVDKDLEKFIRKFQLNRIIKFKL
jgi:glycosyltransferase involved in cell wall biosynthesis